MKNLFNNIFIIFCLLVTSGVKSEEGKEKKYYFTAGGVFTGTFFSAEFMYKTGHMIGASVINDYDRNHLSSSHIVLSPFREAYQVYYSQKRSNNYGGLHYRYFPFEKVNLFVKTSLGISEGQRYKIEDQIGADIQNEKILLPIFQGMRNEKQNYFSSLMLGYRIDQGENSYLLLEAGIGQRLLHESGHVSAGLSSYGLYSLLKGETIDPAKLYWKSKYYESISINKSGSFPLLFFGFGIKF